MACLLDTAAPSDLSVELLIQILPHQIRDSEQGQPTYSDYSRSGNASLEDLRGDEDEKQLG